MNTAITNTGSNMDLALLHRTQSLTPLFNAATVANSDTAPTIAKTLPARVPCFAIGLQSHHKTQKYKENAIAA